jgi:hypothetical protein
VFVGYRGGILRAWDITTKTLVFDLLVYSTHSKNSPPGLLPMFEVADDLPSSMISAFAGFMRRTGGAAESRVFAQRIASDAARPFMRPALGPDGT